MMTFKSLNLLTDHGTFEVLKLTDDCVDGRVNHSDLILVLALPPQHVEVPSKKKCYFTWDNNYVLHCTCLPP